MLLNFVLSFTSGGAPLFLAYAWYARVCVLEIHIYNVEGPLLSDAVCRAGDTFVAWLTDGTVTQVVVKTKKIHKTKIKSGNFLLFLHYQLALCVSSFFFNFLAQFFLWVEQLRLKAWQQQRTPSPWRPTRSDGFERRERERRFDSTVEYKSARRALGFTIELTRM